jgi:molybdopterin-containing oxidoreductase family iron-sulfur binding subunit
MEKCTYCVQRLNEARLNSTTPQTACQQACPRAAIRLIDLRQEHPKQILTTFDAPSTRPRTLYL